jgi:hypothetical protein
LVSLYDFENREKLFHGVDNRTKFCLLTLTGTGAPVGRIDFVFFLTQPEQLSEEERHFSLSKEEIKTLNPNTKTCLTFRSETDATITLSAHESIPALINEAEGANPWGLRFIRTLDVSNDSDLFRSAEEFDQDCKYTGNAFLCDGERWIPVYEGKMLQHFNHRAASVKVNPENLKRQAQPESTDQEQYLDPSYLPTPQFWIRQENLDSIYPEDYSGNWTLAIKKVTSPTNERTLIGTTLPRVACVYSINGMISDCGAMRSTALSAGLSSLVLDYVTRQKLGGVNMAQFVLKQLPVHPPEHYSPELLKYIVPRVLELTYTAWDLTAVADDVWSESNADLQASIESQWQSNVDATGGGHRGKTPPEWVEHSDQADEQFPHPPFMWDEGRRAQLRADLDGLYGHLYGLEREELSYILDTFPIVERQDKEEHGEYRTKRLVLEAYDELAGTALVDGYGSQEESTYTLTDIDLHDLDKEADQEEVEDAFEDLQADLDEEPSLTDDGDTQETTATTRSRSEAFRVGVRKIYDHKCAVCSIEAYGPGDGSTVVDAAHIYPKSEDGADDLRNGLCLCKQHHWAFDEGWFTFTDDHTVRVHPNLPDDSDYDFIREHDGDTLHLPDDERFHPHRIFLRAHRRLCGITVEDGKVRLASRSSGA